MLAAPVGFVSTLAAGMTIKRLSSRRLIGSLLASLFHQCPSF